MKVGSRDSPGETKGATSKRYTQVSEGRRIHSIKIFTHKVKGILKLKAMSEGRRVNVY